MDKKKLIIIVILIAAVVGYFIWKNNAVVPAATIPTTVPPDPGTSNDPGSSLPSPVSVLDPLTTPTIGIATPVAIPSVSAVFSSGTTDADIQGSGSSSDPLGGMPSGFVTWANSLGPKNKSRLFTLIPQMTSDEINMVNNIVVNNLWGNSSVLPAWNTFCAKYSLPVGGKFSNFQAR